MKVSLKSLWDNFKMHVIYICIILVMIAFLATSINKCSNVSGEYKHNIEALNDTIKYYQDKNGNLVATKLAFESDINTLKLLNENLYNQIDSLKLKKNNVKQLIYVGGEISRPESDSTYIISHDTINKGFNKEFNFNDTYRTLEGNVDYKNDSLGVHINKDVVYFDYTVAMDKDNKIYVKSTNPYVKYKEISGFTLPSKKEKRWVVGPSATYGYDILHNNMSLSIGASITYKIISW